MAKKRKLVKSEPEVVPAGESSQDAYEPEQPTKQDPEEPVTADPEESIKQESIEEEPIEEEPIEEEPVEEAICDYEQKTQTLEDAETVPDPSDDSTPTTAAVNGEATAGDGEGFDDDDDDDENSSESIKKLLEPFPKDQLIELLRDAAVKHPDVMEQVHGIADADPVHRKIFVHGLGWDTSAETLAEAFRQYGEIEDCNAVTDKISGKSKGYGFILFKHRSATRRALKEPQKKIGTRMTACQMASAGPVMPPAPPASEYTQRKIYVSNVSADLDPQKLYQFFAKYGEIEEGPLGLDKATGKPKGFTLFVYKTVDSSKKALEEPHKNFEGHILHCQRAIDGLKPNKPGFQQHYGGAFHHGAHHGSGGIGSHGPQFGRNESAGFMGGMANHVPQAGAGHLMAPSPVGMGYNQGPAQAAGLNPALGQALTALLATQGAGLGLTNLLGTMGTTGMGGPMVNQAVQGPGMQGGYGNQVHGVGGNMNPGVMGGYGGPAPMQGGYGNAQMGQGGTGRNRQGVGHMGGAAPYMGH